jgi:hypothetical protein
VVCSLVFSPLFCRSFLMCFSGMLRVAFIAIVCFCIHSSWGVTLQGMTFVSPLSSVSVTTTTLNWTIPFRMLQQNFSELCSGVLSVDQNMSSGAVLYVR